MKRGILIILIELLIIVSTSLWAAHEDGGEAAAFLKNGAGCRPISLGKAFVAIADDVNAVYYNPAGLTQLKLSEITTMYATPFATKVKGIDYHTLGYVYPGKDQALGVYVIGLRVSGISKVNDITIGPESEFSNQEWAALFSCAKSINNKLSLGVTLKIIHQSLEKIKNDSMGLDLGMMLYFGKRVRFALVATDIFSSKLGEDRIPKKVKWGVSWKLGKIFLLSTSLDYTPHRKLKHHGGVEVNILKNFILRTGYSTGNREISGGLGIKVKKFQLDWGYGFNKDLGDTQRVSFTLKF